MTGAAAHTRYGRSSRTVWRDGPGSFLVLVLPVTGTEVVALQGTGAELWRQLAEPMTVRSLAERLAERYEASPAHIMTDIAPVLDDLVSRGVVDQVGAR